MNRDVKIEKVYTPEQKERRRLAVNRYYQRHKDDPTYKEAARRRALRKYRRIRKDPKATRRILDNTKNWAKRRKLAIIAAYGGKCTCCGEKEEVFLTIEHVGGGGKKHREECGNSTRVYIDILKRGCPKDKYTVLCMNCNFATRFNKPCPHKTRNL